MDSAALTALLRADGVDDWRVLDDGLGAWFDAPSTVAGAALVRRAAELSVGTAMPDLDLRATGVRVRIGATGALTDAHLDLARSVSAAARELGLTPDPSVLQTLRVVVETADPEPLKVFWHEVLGYEAADDEALADPSRRDPTFSFRPSPQRATRDRIHVDVVRRPEAVEAARAAVGQEPTGPYGLALADADGNVVDLVPGDPLEGGAETGDWQVLFGAMAFYPAGSPVQAAELATAVAALADGAGVPLLVDVRREGVTLDSGKDLWDRGDGTADSRFVDLARAVQAAARGLGLRADPTRLRFVQFGIDAVDVPSLRAFWAAVLGYELDQRERVGDVVDPRRLNPVLFFQQADAGDARRRAHRNRLRLDLAVPHEHVQARVDAAVAAGGEVVEHDGRRTIVDPEGNETVLVTPPTP